jgi:outer membrane protein OmpA-like peptidoglycan-associated protein
MRTSLVLLLSTLALTGCGGGMTSFVHSDTTLGRVVVYRNGVAYFERSAHIDGSVLHLSVPGDKVDDFLKSLTVIDAKTSQPAPISYPTSPTKLVDGLIDMQILLGGQGPHDLRLTYVTEAPAWKPSYRIVLGQANKVALQAWAIIDNTSGEDWQGVKLGVGASSALSFRFDLQSIRLVQRETLRADDLFAQAPPTGGATHDGRPVEKKVLADLSDASLNAAQAQAMPPPPPVASLSGKKASPKPSQAMPPADTAGVAGGSMGRGHSSRAELKKEEAMADRSRQPQAAPQSPQAAQAAAEFNALTQRIQSMKGQVVIEGFADRGDADKLSASLERANKAREQLIRNGIAPDKVVAVGKGEGQGRGAGVRFVEAPQAPAEPRPAAGGEGKDEGGTSDPIGTSHFESTASMTVPRGTSAMVSILQADAEGEVVYLFDAESPRGNSSFPFKAVRIRNPTDSALETGPVTVFGEGRFIGEGMSEPIPARSVAFVPFALDRQIVVERKSTDQDSISRILAVQRGVFSTEVQHTKRTVFTLINRLPEKVSVYVRHTVPAGYKLTKSPPVAEKLNDAHLFRVEIEPNGKSELAIEESTPVFRSADVRSSEGMGMVKLYLSSAVVAGPLKEKVAELLRLQQEIGTLDQQIGSMRDQMAEFKMRMDELHAQLVTLRAVKNPQGNLMQHLEKKLQEVNERLSKATLDLVGLQEKLMVARIRFQDGVAELSLEKAPEKP